MLWCGAMERVSRQQVAVYAALLGAGVGWITCQEIAAVGGVAERTARLHCQRLHRDGILDQRRTYPAHRFKISTPTPAHIDYHEHMMQAAEAHGITLAASA
jgi:hypothetical protein